MYFREKETRNGRFLQLVRGCRGADGKVRQQIVLSLGGGWIPLERRHEVVRLVEGALCGRQELLEASPEAVSLADIVLDRMRTEGKLDLERRMSQCALPAGASASGVLLDHVNHGESRQLASCFPFGKHGKALP